MNGEFEEGLRQFLEFGFDEATPLETGTHDGPAIERGERHFYRVSVDEDTELVVETTFDSTVVDLDVYLYEGPSISEIIRASMAESGAGSVSVTARETTTYYIQIDAFAGGPSAYTLTVSTSDVPPLSPPEPAAELLNAESLEPGTYPDNRIAWDERHFYAIETSEGSTLSVDLTFDEATTDLHLFVYNGQAFEQLVGYALSSSEREGVTVESDGRTYYIEVHAFDTADGGTATYTLTAQVTGVDTEPRPARFEVESFSVPGTVQMGDRVRLTATIVNTGERAASQSVSAGIDFNGDGELQGVATEELTLDASERHTFSRLVSIPPHIRPGRYDVGVWTQHETARTTVTVEPAESNES